MNVSNTALVLIDMQNDFVHPDGTCSRNGQKLASSRSLIEQLIKATEAMRARKGYLISAQFTLVANQNSQPIIMPSLKESYSFLGRGDFQVGRWGHSLIEELKPVNYSINKISDSAFYHTHLNWLLRMLEIDTLIFAGIETHRGISSSLRDAHTRGFKTILLADGCSAINEDAHRETLESLSHITEVKTCSEFANLLQI